MMAQGLCQCVMELKLEFRRNKKMKNIKNNNENNYLTKTTLGQAMSEILGKDCTEYESKDDLLDDLTSCFWIMYKEEHHE